MGYEQNSSLPTKEYPAQFLNLISVHTSNPSQFSMSHCLFSEEGRSARSDFKRSSIIRDSREISHHLFDRPLSPFVVIIFPSILSGLCVFNIDVLIPISPSRLLIGHINTIRYVFLIQRLIISSFQGLPKEGLLQVFEHDRSQASQIVLRGPYWNHDNLILLINDLQKYIGGFWYNTEKMNDKYYSNDFLSKFTRPLHCLGHPFF